MVNKIKEPKVAKAPSNIPKTPVGKAPKGTIPKAKQAEYEMPQPVPTKGKVKQSGYVLPQPVPTKKARSKRGM